MLIVVLGLSFTVYTNLNKHSDDCKLCCSYIFEERDSRGIRKDALGILCVRIGEIIPLRFYELDDSGAKIFAKGYTSMQSFSNYYGKSGGMLLHNVDTREARIIINDHENNYFYPNDLKKLYCKKCQEKIKALNANFDFVLMDYNDYEVYSLAKEINKMQIRDYTISSQNLSWTEIRVRYTPN